ncbi:tetratricopeptide repeat protein [Actinoplanes italicus]|uniref:tetratricopeptide repeat protein n=1 Tax=Actinoplanes italicus TaxID=113567 RepID=UPI001473436B|nr:tetratricopeptide repeat protein [Actinoplanes italicus]
MRAESGFAYGAIGADIHVFGDGSPVYLLERWVPSRSADSEWLREVPSRMLNSRFAVVEFVGRDVEMADLRSWREDRRSRSARWMYGAGGIGKSRLAAEFAAQSAAEGWLVAMATHGPGSVLLPPGSQDLRPDGTAGLLLIVDYADRWPFQHLTWLLSNAQLHQVGRPTRILMLARTNDVWPAVRGSLANAQFSVSSTHLASLPDDAGSGNRTEMFTAARVAFGARYGLSEVASIDSPLPLNDEDMGLTLAIHMAALVAVDAYVRGRPPPRDMADLTIYLLDREHTHWAHRHATDPGRLDPPTMDRVVFTAVLGGPVRRSLGTTLVQALQVAPPSDLVLDDHLSCYPAATDGSVLEPLYPDRLAEDFLSLTLPGHETDYPAQRWAVATVGQVVRSREPAVLARLATFLTAAAERWPHVGETCLFPLLRERPEIAVEAGSAALTAIARLPAVGVDVLAAIEPHLPPAQHMTLDVGTAEVLAELTRRRLAATTDVLERAELHAALVPRLHQAGRFDEALAVARDAVAGFREVAGPARPAHQEALAHALINLSAAENRANHTDAANSAAAEAVSILQDLPGTGALELATALAAQSRAAFDDGDRPAAVTALRRAVETLRSSRVQDQAVQTLLAGTMMNLSGMLPGLASRSAAHAVAAEAVAIYRELAARDPQTYRPDLAGALINLAGHTTGRRFSGGLRRGTAQRLLRESVSLFRELERSNPDFYREPLAMALSNLSIVLSGRENRTEASAVAAESVQLRRRLAERNPVRHLHDLASGLDTYGSRLAMTDRRDEALAAMTESAEILLRLFQADPRRYGERLAASHRRLGTYLKSLTFYERGNPRRMRAMLQSAAFRAAMEDGRRVHAAITTALTSDAAPILARERDEPRSAETPDRPITPVNPEEHDDPHGHFEQAIYLADRLHARIGAFLQAPGDATPLLAEQARAEADTVRRIGADYRSDAATGLFQTLAMFHALRFQLTEGVGKAEEIAYAAAALDRLDEEDAPVGDVVRTTVAEGLDVVMDYAAAVADQHPDEAAALFAPLARHLPRGHPRRGELLSDYWDVVYSRYERTRQSGDLDHAVQLAREAAALTAADDPNRAARFSKLATSLRSAYLSTGNARLAAEQVDSARESLAATAREHRSYAYRLRGLCQALCDRFEADRSGADLEEAVHIGRQALEAWPGGDPVKAELQAVVSRALFLTYEHRLGRAALDEAIELSISAARGMPAGHSHRRTALINLARHRHARAMLTGSYDDLEGAIAAVREVLELTPPENPDRAHYATMLRQLSHTRSTQFSADGLGS